jgi:hypothetical protein
MGKWIMRTYSYWAVQPSRKQPDPKPWSPRAWMEEREYRKPSRIVRRESYWPPVRRDAKMFLFFATSRWRACLGRRNSYGVIGPMNEDPVVWCAMG